MWHAIVVGSGVGGLAAAAALGKRGKRVLLLEQHTVAGGQTQTFRRQDWVFATGVHYISGVGPPKCDCLRQGRSERIIGALLDCATASFRKRHGLPHAQPLDVIGVQPLDAGLQGSVTTSLLLTPALQLMRRCRAQSMGCRSTACRTQLRSTAWRVKQP